MNVGVSQIQTGTLFSRIFIIFLSLCALFVIFGRVVNIENFSLTVWGDRDLWRGLEGLTNNHYNGRGPETNSGYRAFGGFFYQLLTFVFFIWADIRAANVAVTGLYAIAIIIPSTMLWREVSPIAGVITALALTGAGLAKSALLVWNPGFIIFFASTFVVCTYFLVKNGNPVYLGIMTLAAALGSQIHMQILILVAALPLILFFYRVKLKWIFVPAITLGLLVAYLPSMLLETQLISNTRNLGAMGANISLYASFDLGDTFERLKTLSINFVDATGGSYRHLGRLFDTKYEVIKPILWTADTIAIISLFLSLLYYRPSIYRRSQVDQPVGVFVLFSATYFVVFAFADVNFRHFVASLPALSILVALGATQFHRLFARFFPPQTSKVLGGFLICFLGARSLITGGVDFGFANVAADSYRAHNEIAKHVKKEYAIDYETFERTASLFKITSNGSEFVPHSIGGRMASIFYMATKSATAKRSPGKCLAIIIKPSPSQLNIKKTLKQVEDTLSATFGKLAMGATTMSDRFFYINYQTRSGNCLKTFTNPYIPTAFEKKYLQRSNFETQETFSTQKISPTRSIFIFKGQSTPLPWSLDFTKSGTSINLTLHGRAFRGHSGLAHQELSDLKVSLIGDAQVYVFDFNELTIGNRQNGTLAPWRTRYKIVPDGNYTLRLSAQTNDQIKLAFELGTITVSLEGLETSVTGNLRPMSPQNLGS